MTPHRDSPHEQAHPRQATRGTCQALAITAYPPTFAYAGSEGIHTLACVAAKIGSQAAADPPTSTRSCTSAHTACHPGLTAPTNCAPTAAIAWSAVGHGEVPLAKSQHAPQPGPLGVTRRDHAVDALPAQPREVGERVRHANLEGRRQRTDRLARRRVDDQDLRGASPDVDQADQPRVGLSALTTGLGEGVGQRGHTLRGHQRPLQHPLPLLGSPTHPQDAPRPCLPGTVPLGRVLPQGHSGGRHDSCRRAQRPQRLRDQGHDMGVLKPPVGRGTNAKGSHVAWSPTCHRWPSISRGGSAYPFSHAPSAAAIWAGHNTRVSAGTNPLTAPWPPSSATSARRCLLSGNPRGSATPPSAVAVTRRPKHPSAAGAGPPAADAVGVGAWPPFLSRRKDKAHGSA